MKDDIEEYKAGSLVVFSEGEYSDYGHRGHFVVLQDMNIYQMREAAARAAVTGHGYSKSDRAKNGIISELIRYGFLLEVNVTEIYTGAYGGIDEAFGVFSGDID